MHHAPLATRLARHSVALLLCHAIGCSGEAPAEPTRDMSLSSPDMSAADASGIEDLSTAPPDAGEMGEGTSRDAGLEEMALPLEDQGSDAGEEMSAPDMAPLPEQVILVAAGRMGRTVASCDGGESWIGDRDLAAEGDAQYCGVAQPEIACGQTPCQQLRNDGCEMEAVCTCSGHEPGETRGLAFGEGWFIAVVGWGTPAIKIRSRDGLQWEVVDRGGSTPGIYHYEDRFILGGTGFTTSTDGGTSWVSTMDRIKELGQHAVVSYIPTSGYYFIRGDTGVARSKDGGASWEVITAQMPEKCVGNQNRAMVSLGRKAVFVGGTASMPELCVSQDGGETWMSEPIARGEINSELTASATAIYSWGGKGRFVSTDGLTWTAEPYTSVPRDTAVQEVLHDPVHGRFVMLTRGEYGTQRILLSEDGLSWREGGALPPRHGLKFLKLGVAPEGFVCPDVPR